MGTSVKGWGQFRPSTPRQVARGARSGRHNGAEPNCHNHPPAQLVHALVHETKPDSFPSGHTAFAVALLAGTILALKVAHHSTRWAWALGIPAVLVVAASRLYLGAHYLGDVVGSYLFAGGTVLILGAVLSLARTRVLARASTQS